MNILQHHKVPVLTEKIRLSDYAVGIFNQVPTKSGVKKAIKKGLICVNGIRGVSGQFLLGNEELTLIEDESLQKKNIQMPLDILYQDNFLAVIYKPAGMLVSGNKAKTISNALEFNLQVSSEKDAVKPQPIHRLDFATSGLLLVGKTARSLHVLGDLFKDRKIQKTYIAITQGKMLTEGQITSPIEDKESVSMFKVLKTVPSEKYTCLNWVELKPLTGRRHQLRIHCAYLGTPILGDTLYGKEGAVLKGKGLFLHAQSLSFKHPFLDKKLEVFKEVPSKFKRLMEF
ncbi:RluA family pseudouridine synthase [Ochrovirga pacifica]|uniref:RluA family pseudouridine synthase n=1 Tax=Ochrovirga pacifica TaxID=1042376 RepID=UPI000255875B|nr:RluA family pseudouridine synthase [Ochrovirga pacifica]